MSGRIYSFGEFELDLERTELRRAGVEENLDPTPFRLLVYLVENNDRSVPKHELLDRVWPDSVVSDTALSSALKEVRKALGDDGQAQRYVRTLRGRGYRFVPAVESSGPASPEPETTRRHCLAVLPFESLDSDPEGDYFADGITEDIIAHLAKLPELWVVSRHSSGQFKRSEESLSEIAETLGVDLILQGSVRRAEDRVRIVAQLVEGDSERVRWAKTWDDRIDSVLRIQEDVAARIAAELEIELSSAERKALSYGSTEHIGAYDYYLRGRAHYRRWEKTSNETAIELYKKAIEIDPDFALAHAGLANAYGLRGCNFGFGDEWSDASIGSARHALGIAGELPEAHKALGLAFHSKGWPRKALEAYLAATEARPTYDEAVYNVSQALYELGRWDEAVGWQKRRLQLDPMPEVIGLATYGWYLWCLGFTEEAARCFESVIADRPLLVEAIRWIATRDLLEGRVSEARERIERLRDVNPADADCVRLCGRIEMLAGESEAAHASFAEALRLSHGRDIYARLSLGRLALAAGKNDEADEALSAAEQAALFALDRDDQAWERRWELAAIAAIRGESKDATAWLKRAVDAGHRFHFWDDLEPSFDAIREDPGFQHELDRMRESVGEMKRNALEGRWHRLDGEPPALPTQA